MINFERFILNNGLRLLINENKDTSICTINTLYDVGARDENPNHTGLAHLMEHLMFEGSENVDSYDDALQMAGGESNAFTNSDSTNYYLYLPSQNIETGFWLESDRLLGLSLTEEKVEIQKKVVLEEFEETTHDIPYGMVWHHIRNLSYEKHPYRWPVIGETPQHVAKTSLADINNFYEKHYQPQHTIWVISGPNKTDEVLKLADKWLSGIENKTAYHRHLPKENWEQKTYQELNVVEETPPPSTAIYLAFLMPDRMHKDYYACEFLSDVLATGQSCRLIQNLVKQQQFFSQIDCFVTGDIDEGLFIIEGRLAPNANAKEAEQAVWNELEKLASKTVSPQELERVKNQIESHITFSESSAMNLSINLAMYEQMGDVEEINKEIHKIRALTADHIQTVAQQLFQRSNCSTVRYLV